MSKRKQILLYLIIFSSVSALTYGILHRFVTEQYPLIKTMVSLNLSSFIIFGFDKTMSRSENMPRLPENFFHLISLFGGATGIVIGAYTFRHKTRKLSFLAWPFLIMLIQFVLLGVYLSQRYNFI